MPTHQAPAEEGATAQHAPAKIVEVMTMVLLGLEAHITHTTPSVGRPHLVNTSLAELCYVGRLSYHSTSLLVLF